MNEITAPLREMLKKNARFKWTAACEKSFQKLKSTFTSDEGAISFSHPDDLPPSKKMIVHPLLKEMVNGRLDDKVMAHWVQGRDTELIVDRGPERIAATLYQKEDDTGFWRPVNSYRLLYLQYFSSGKNSKFTML